MNAKFLVTVAAVVAVAAVIAATNAEAKPIFIGGPHHFHHGGFGLAAGLFGAAALTVAAANASYGGCYYASRRVYDDWGHFVGYRSVNVCN